MSIAGRTVAGSRAGGNPFEFGQSVRPESIVDREEELRRLVTAARNRERLFLIGPRRFGKTSLLHIAQRELERQGCIVLNYDAERYESIELLAQALMAGALLAFTGRLEKLSAAAGRRISRFFGALDPQVKYDLTENELSVSFGAGRRAASARSDLPLLTDVLDGINRMAEDAGRTVTIVIDGFQQLVTVGGLVAERQLRASVQTHRQLGYVFAGSKTHLLTDMVTRHSRPFYRMGSSLFLGPVPRQPFAEFLRSGFAAGGFGADAEAIDRILDLAEDVPYSVQRLAHRCWDLLNAGGPGLPGQLNPRFVDHVLERIALEDDPAYTRIWLSLTTTQKKALKAVIGREGRSLFSKAATQGYGLTPASMQKALKALNQQGLIREEQAIGSIRWRLDDPFLATWLRLAQSAPATVTSAAPTT